MRQNRLHGSTQQKGAAKPHHFAALLTKEKRPVQLTKARRGAGAIFLWQILQV
jgi:hypothetical protein